MRPSFFALVSRLTFRPYVCLLLPIAILKPPRPATGVPELQADRRNKGS
jgi:hypothetical protein